MVMGRPPKKERDKKCKMNVSLDREVSDYLNKLDNKSAWLNCAALSRIKYERRLELAKKSRDKIKREGS